MELLSARASSACQWMAPMTLCRHQGILHEYPREGGAGELLSLQHHRRVEEWLAVTKVFHMDGQLRCRIR